MLVTCLYASRANVTPTNETLDEVLTQSRTNNPNLGVTGLLGYTNDIYVQVLEGGRNSVCGLFNRIVKDERHHHVRILAFNEVTERRFGAWTMGQVNVDAINSALLLKYSEIPAFDPFTMTGAATMSLLLELIDSGAIVSRSI